jgi:hypothetical protein
MSEIINLYKLDIYKTYLKDIDNAKLIEEITQHSISSNLSNVPKNGVANPKNPNPTHTFYEDQLYPFGQPEAMKLLQEITKQVNFFANSDMVIDSVWSIALEQNESVLFHSHKVNTQLYPEEYYSVSYYVSAPEDSADLIFETTHCNTIERATSVKTETGMLLIFNSFIPHMTNRQYAKEKRIVVSANYSPRHPNQKPSADWSEYAVPEEYKS